MEVTVEQGHPIAPTEFFKGWSPTEQSCQHAPEGQIQPDAVIYTPQKEETRRSITSDQKSNGYRPGPTPRNLMKFLAKGQLSTDLRVTKRNKSRLGFSSPHQHPTEGVRIVD